MFALDDLEHRYGSTRVLDIPSWHANAGDAWLLAGPSGSGKSTLLHILAGLTRPTRGRVVVAQTDVNALSMSAADRWRGRTVGLVPQRLHLIAAARVHENVRLAQTLAGVEADDDRIGAILEALQIGGLARRYPRELSQGQAQRVAIARAVINRPALVLADEPTANLDDAHAAAALELLRTQALEAGATLVVASHDARVRSLLPNAFTLPAVHATIA